MTENIDDGSGIPRIAVSPEQVSIDSEGRVVINNQAYADWVLEALSVRGVNQPTFGIPGIDIGCDKNKNCGCGRR
jgi:hypothetical protein